jgi:hypothetical protein
MYLELDPSGLSAGGLRGRNREYPLLQIEYWLISSTTLFTDVKLLDLPIPQTPFKEVRYLENVDRIRQTASKALKHPCTSTKLPETISPDSSLHPFTEPTGVSPMELRTISLLLDQHPLLPPTLTMPTLLVQPPKQQLHRLLLPLPYLAAGPLWVVWSIAPILELLMLGPHPPTT